MLPGVLVVAILGISQVAARQAPPPTTPVRRLAPGVNGPTGPTATVEKIGDNLLRLGSIEIDTLHRSLTVSGRSNDVTTLEFVANTQGGMKAYESALTLETTGVKFNTALMLIGLDPAHARRPSHALDQTPPAGDAVEITVEWLRGGERVRIGADELIYDAPARTVLTGTKWVYTGSAFIAQVGYLADLDGVLIGFVHSPSPVIESPRGLGNRRYGDLVLNPALRLTPGTLVKLTIRAVQ